MCLLLIIVYLLCIKCKDVYVRVAFSYISMIRVEGVAECVNGLSSDLIRGPTSWYWNYGTEFCLQFQVNSFTL